MRIDDDAALALLLLAGFTGPLFGRGRKADKVIVWGEGWTWPVPDLVLKTAIPPGGDAKYPAMITQEFRPGSDAKPHRGVDIMYPRLMVGDRAEYTTKPDKDGVRNGTTMFFAPPTTPIVAAKDGIVWFCAKTSRGWAIVLDHGKPFATFYTHLASTHISPHHMGKMIIGKERREPQRVLAGENLGIMGADPQDPQRLRHLHFEVWHDGAGNDAAVDLGRTGKSPMSNWRRTTWTLNPQ